MKAAASNSLRFGPLIGFCLGPVRSRDSFGPQVIVPLYLLWSHYFQWKSTQNRVELPLVRERSGRGPGREGGRPVLVDGVALTGAAAEGLALAPGVEGVRRVGVGTGPHPGRKKGSITPDQWWVQLARGGVQTKGGRTLVGGSGSLVGGGGGGAGGDGLQIEGIPMLPLPVPQCAKYWESQVEGRGEVIRE